MIELPNVARPSGWSFILEFPDGAWHSCDINDDSTPTVDTMWKRAADVCSEVIQPGMRIRVGLIRSDYDGTGDAEIAWLGHRVV